MLVILRETVEACHSCHHFCVILYDPDHDLESSRIHVDTLGHTPAPSVSVKS